MYVARYSVNTIPPTSSVAKLATASPCRLIKTITFSASIEKLSPIFCKTYSEALIAEENNFKQICGPGYRRALEFLIKDFLIGYVFKDQADKQEIVKNTFLGTCIEKFLEEKRIKDCAKRAAWLGNDAIHYLQKWEGKDITDLKMLINMTVNWVDLYIESDIILQDMPDKKD
jgi:hypothetical protein